MPQLRTFRAAVLAVTPFALPCTAGAQEVSADCSTPNEPVWLCYGEHTACSISPIADMDTFRFYGQAGDPVRITVDSPNGLDPVLTVLDPGGQPIGGESCANGCSFSYDLPLATTGIHTLLLSDGGNNEAGNYVLSLHRVPPLTSIPVVEYNQPFDVVIDYTGDHDFFAFHGEAGSHISIAVNSPNGADPILTLWDPAGQTVSQSCANGCSFLMDIPSLHFTGTYVLIFSEGGWNETGVYDVSLNCIWSPSGSCGAPLPDGPLGTGYCLANVNSTGNAASISATGSDVLADDRVFLRASDVPSGELGIFIAGVNTNQVPLPFPSQGILCIGSPVVRLSVVPSCNANQMEYRPDLAALPILPGQDWRFQAWFRDGSSSNTTDGLTITFW